MCLRKPPGPEGFQLLLMKEAIEQREEGAAHQQRPDRSFWDAARSMN